MFREGSAGGDGAFRHVPDILTRGFMERKQFPKPGKTGDDLSPLASLTWRGAAEPESPRAG